MYLTHSIRTEIEGKKRDKRSKQHTDRRDREQKNHISDQYFYLQMQMKTVSSNRQPNKVSIDLMEALVNARITPVRTYKGQDYSIQRSFVPTFSKKLFRGPLGMMSHPKSLNSVAASIQPLKTSGPTHFDNTLPSKEVLEIWQTADAVCFDVDSTVCMDEGIDELAEFCGAGKAVAEWTARAMSGSIPFEEALAARLSLFNPSLSQIQEFLKRPPSICALHGLTTFFGKYY
ncbi:hypothetical protein RJ641_009432 [Dillenia turbinata]|uniref:Phosphoserine phosphatase n=1 Tax=Dillenia turbinata TaxID=194707 RepID=A0AAN8V7R8_9MAGN